MFQYRSSLHVVHCRWKSYGLVANDHNALVKTQKIKQLIKGKLSPEQSRKIYLGPIPANQNDFKLKSFRCMIRGTIDSTSIRPQALWASVTQKAEGCWWEHFPIDVSRSPGQPRFSPLRLWLMLGFVTTDSLLFCVVAALTAFVIVVATCKSIDCDCEYIFPVSTLLTSPALHLELKIRVRATFLLATAQNGHPMESGELTFFFFFVWMRPSIEIDWTGKPLLCWPVLHFNCMQLSLCVPAVVAVIVAVHSNHMLGHRWTMNAFTVQIKEINFLGNSSHGNVHMLQSQLCKQFITNAILRRKLKT